MPSRKRTKGQARKAKRSSSAVPLPPTANSLLRMEHLDLAECQHGLDPPSMVYAKTLRRFYDIYLGEWDEKNTLNFVQSSMIGMMRSIERVPELWVDEVSRQMLRDYLVAHGTNIILDDKDADINIRVAGAVAAAVLSVENYNPSKNCSENFFTLNNDDAFRGCERALVRFFRRRIPCSCLDKRYAEVKRLPKTGMCHGCNQRKERCCMMFCTRCEVHQYCSKECQGADWPRHKVMCEKLRLKELPMYIHSK